MGALAAPGRWGFEGFAAFEGVFPRKLLFTLFMFFENFKFSLRRAYPCGALRRPQALVFAWKLSLSLLCFLEFLIDPLDALEALLF